MVSSQKAVALSGLIQVSLFFSKFIVSIVFSHLLSPSDFGVAMTIGLVLMLFECTSNFGHELFFMRSSKGGRLAFQANIHAYLILRGIVVSLLILLISPRINSFLSIPQEVFNYAYLAVIPLINAFMHTDHHRVHKYNNYSLTARISITADIAAIIVALACAKLIGGYWAFLTAFILKYCLTTCLSHIFARRFYIVRLNKSYIHGLIVFGYPLIIISLLRWIGTEYDKIVITKYLGVEQFGGYFIVVMLAASLLYVINLSFLKIFIRRVVNQPTIASKFNVIKENGMVFLLIILPLLFLFCQLGDGFIGLVYSSNVEKTYFLLPVVTLLISLRVLSVWLDQSLVALGKTKEMIIANVFRLTGLIIAVIVVKSGYGINYICLSFCVGEFVYLLTSAYILNRISSNFISCVFYYIIILFLSALTAMVVYYYLYSSSLFMKLIVSVFIYILMLTLFYNLSSICRSHMKATFLYFKKYDFNRFREFI